MRHSKGWLQTLLLICMAGPLTAFAAERDAAVLLTLEWPPYTGSKLPDSGTVSKRVRDAYAAAGQDVNFGFFAWRRAMRLPYTDHRFTAFFPAYPSPERRRVCHLSEPVGMSPLGIAQTRKKPLQWTKVDDLAQYKVGVVEAYANEDRFDQLMQQGIIKTTSSETDVDNLINLGRGKVDAAVIDSQVFDWLLRNEPRLKPYRNSLQMNQRLLVTWPLYVCFRRDSEGAAQRDQFNAGLMAQHEKVLATSQSPEKPAKPKRR